MYRNIQKDIQKENKSRKKKKPKNYRCFVNWYLPVNKAPVVSLQESFRNKFL